MDADSSNTDSDRNNTKIIIGRYREGPAQNLMFGHISLTFLVREY